MIGGGMERKRKKARETGRAIVERPDVTRQCITTTVDCTRCSRKTRRKEETSEQNVEGRKKDREQEREREGGGRAGER